jgi:hypothetical protein
VERVWVMRRPDSSFWVKYLGDDIMSGAKVVTKIFSHHERQFSANRCRSLREKSKGVDDRFLPPGGGVGLPERPGKEGEVGDIIRPLALGLVGGDIVGEEGRS